MHLLQGVLLFRSEKCPAGAEGALKIARLWVHEVYRVFYDRLVDDQDRHTFFGIVKVISGYIYFNTSYINAYKTHCIYSIQNATTFHFKEKMTNIFQHLLTGQYKRKEITDSHIRKVFFGDYMSPKMADSSAERLYDEVVDPDGMECFFNARMHYSIILMSLL